jgi:hypothetical protein
VRLSSTRTQAFGPATAINQLLQVKGFVQGTQPARDWVVFLPWCRSVMMRTWPCARPNTRQLFRIYRGSLVKRPCLARYPSRPPDQTISTLTVHGENGLLLFDRVIHTLSRRSVDARARACPISVWARWRAASQTRGSARRSRACPSARRCGADTPGLAPTKRWPLSVITL